MDKGDEPYHTGYVKVSEDDKTFGPATAAGEPIGYGDVADLTVNTAKGIAKGMGKWLKGDSEGSTKALEDTAAENREISRRAAKNYKKK